MTPAIGETAPTFELPDTEGDRHSLNGDGEAAAATVLVFTCNHCPYALAWHDRLLDVGREYASRGVRMLLVNSNDAERYPRDSYDAMRARVRDDGGWPVPYLHDEDQRVAHAYDARVTPDVFVIAADGAIVYRGAPDADHGDPALAAGWLRDALDDVLTGRAVDRAETKPVGCTIKWRQ